MGFLDRLFGRKEEARSHPAAPTYHGSGEREHQPLDANGQALQRYRYMLRTAPRDDRAGPRRGVREANAVPESAGTARAGDGNAGG